MSAKQNIKITFTDDEMIIPVSQGPSVLEIARSAGIKIYAPCGGQGMCGRCRVHVQGEYELPPGWKEGDNSASKEGDVLACKCVPTGDIEVVIPNSSRPGEARILTRSRAAHVKINPPVKKTYISLPPASIMDNICDHARIARALGYITNNFQISLDVLKTLGRTIREANWKISATVGKVGETPCLIHVERGNTTDRMFGIAVDIGTTTLVVNLVDLVNGDIVATAASENDQIPYGEDVISRITYTKEVPGGLTTLRDAVLSTINRSIKEVVDRSDVKVDEITSASFAGNTIMTHLLVGIPPDTIQLEPYIPTICQADGFTAGELGIHINSSAPVYILPSRAGFVGGDITADILACGMHMSKGISLMIDVGTNGEVVLGNREWLMACSCSAGPAFEGGEVEHGMRAEKGAIEKVSIGEDLEVSYKTIGGTPPRGLCGSGLIDLIADLFLRGFIDRAGTLLESGSDRLLDLEKMDPDGYGQAFIVATARESETGKPIYVTESDIKNILRTKASMYAACSMLVNNAGITFADIDKIYISGGFGRHLDAWKSQLLGLLPDVDEWRYDFIGNGSLEGARLSLLSEEYQKEAIKVFRNMTYLELSVTQEFMDEFSSAKFIPHTDLSRFPKVQKALADRMEGTYLDKRNTVVNE